MSSRLTNGKTFVELLQKLETKSNYSVRHKGKHRIIVKDDKIPVPETLRRPLIEWYHTNLCHPGTDRTEQTIRRSFTWKNVRRDVRRHTKNCEECQRLKTKTTKYGHLPAKKAEYVPWRKLCVDLIGPYKVQDGKGHVHELLALTMIDPATSWFEICEIPNKESETVALALDRQWLCRYPRPTYITYDQGGEFTGKEFQELLDSYGIKAKPATSRNPQSNSVVERVHLTLHNMLRTFDLQVRDMDPLDPWSGYLAAVAFAIRSTYHTTTKATPAELVFGRDMIIERSFEANWDDIRQQKQKLINDNNTRENKKRKYHDYRVGDQVLYRRRKTAKHNRPYDGPFTITHVHSNGNVTIARDSRVKQRVNIRLIHPFSPRTS